MMMMEEFVFTGRPCLATISWTAETPVSTVSRTMMAKMLP